MLNHAQRAAIQAALGYLLDEDHAAAEPEWIEERTGYTAEEIRRASFELAQTMIPRNAGEPRFQVSDWTNADGSVTSCVVDTAQVGSDGEALIAARDVDEPTAETVREALERVLPSSDSRRGWIIPAPWDGPELKLDPATEEDHGPGLPASRALSVLSDAAELVLSEPSMGDPEEMLARVMLAAGALFATGQGTLYQCFRTAAIWERG